MKRVVQLFPRQRRPRDPVSEISRVKPARPRDGIGSSPSFSFLPFWCSLSPFTKANIRWPLSPFFFLSVCPRILTASPKVRFWFAGRRIGVRVTVRRPSRFPLIGRPVFLIRCVDIPSTPFFFQLAVGFARKLSEVPLSVRQGSPKSGSTMVFSFFFFV